MTIASIMTVWDIVDDVDVYVGENLANIFSTPTLSNQNNDFERRH